MCRGRFETGATVDSASRETALILYPQHSVAALDDGGNNWSVVVVRSSGRSAARLYESSDATREPNRYRSIVGGIGTLQ